MSVYVKYRQAAGGTVCFVLLFLVNAITSYAQNQWDTDGGVENVEIEIVKERQIVLPAASRNFEKVPPRPVEPIKPEITYSFKNILFSAPDFTPVIRPLRLKQETISKLYGNYISAGIGNYVAPYLEARFNSKRNKEKFYGLELYHQSYGSGPVDGRNSGSGNSRLRLFGRMYNKSIAAGAFFNQENIATHFYGYTPGENVNRDNIRQVYNISTLGVDIENAAPSDFNYNLKTGFSYLYDDYRASEGEVDLNFSSSYKINEDQKIILTSDYFLITRKDEFVGARPRHLLKINPAYTFSPIEKLSVTAGINTAYENDVIGKNKPFHVYPNFMANYALGEGVDAYAALTGDIDKVSLQTLARENLWVNSNIGVYHTNRSVEFAAGLKGKLGKKIGFGTGLSFANLKNLYFYQNNAADRSKFDVVYDDGNTQRTNLFAQLNFNHAEKISFLIRGDYFNYATDKIVTAYHRPTYRLMVNSSFFIYSKLMVQPDLTAQGGMKTLDPQLNRVVELSPAVDLNLKTEYFLSPRASVFVKVNNMLANKYQLYLNYPVRGLQVSAGFSWSF
jgi:hypothetical protein